jgi:hypothetical protein
MADDWESVFTQTVDEYYAGNLAVGAAACEALLSRRDLPTEVRAAVLRNSVFYARTLGELVPEAAFVQIQLPLPRGWNSYNPSILTTDDGFLLSVRSSNWEFRRHEYYRVHADDGVARSQNYLLELDRRLHIARVQLVRDETDRTGERPAFNRGYNDLRLIQHAGSLRAIASTQDFSPRELSQMVLLDLQDGCLTNRTLLSDGCSRSEKNWSPAIWRSELLLVYSFAPMTVLRWDGQRLLSIGQHEETYPPIALDVRGGSQLTPTDSIYLTIVHSGADFSDTSRVYLHRFIAFDKEFRILGISPPFTFLNRGVEFAAGLSIRDESVYVSFGSKDMEAWVVKMPLDRVMKLLSNPTDLTPPGYRTLQTPFQQCPLGNGPIEL